MEKGAVRWTVVGWWRCGRDVWHVSESLIVGGSELEGLRFCSSVLAFRYWEAGLDCCSDSNLAHMCERRHTDQLIRVYLCLRLDFILNFSDVNLRS